ncbi:MAG: hypothetical protein AB4038_10830 [Prochloraceae cyanobacterium]
MFSGSYDQRLKIWQLATGKEIITFTGEGSIDCCGITLDSKIIIAGDGSGKVHFLRLQGVEVHS